MYCTLGAASIGTAGITLSGNGTYIFRINGALTTVANSHVTLIGSSACDVFWTPTQATTLGANTAFAGTVIDAAGVTLGVNATWMGIILAFGGTVTTGVDDNITAAICSPPPATLHIIKQVVNGSGGIASASLFNLHIKFSGIDVAGSPASGTGAPGTPYSLSAGTYVVSEDNNSSYIPSFNGACDSSGNILLSSGDNKTCTITNTFIPPILTPISPTVRTGGGGPSPIVIPIDICPNGDFSSGSHD